MIGRWLELRVIRVYHSDSKAMWEVAIVLSGEVPIRGDTGRKINVKENEVGVC